MQLLILVDWLEHAGELEGVDDLCEVFTRGWIGREDGRRRCFGEVICVVDG